MPQFFSLVGLEVNVTIRSIFQTGMKYIFFDTLRIMFVTFNIRAVHFTATHTCVIPVPTIRGYRNLLAKCRDSGTTGTSFGRIPLRYSRNDEPF